MQKKDKLLKEAFSVYQSANMEKYDENVSGRDEFPEYTEGFEDRIYHCIERMHITNPRAKARRIKFAILGMIALCCIGIFLFYQYKHKPVEVTKQLENLFQEAYEWHCGYDPEYIPPKVFEKGKGLRYEAILLNTELVEKVEKLDLPCRKTGKIMSNGYSDFCGTGVGPYWNVYELTDRKSHYYYILKDNAGQMAIARYVSVWNGYEAQEDRLGTDTICKEIFGVETAKDIRSVTLERYQAKSESDPERLMAMYTSKRDKENILSVFGRKNSIYQVGENEEEDVTEKSHSDEKLSEKSWADAIADTPENCYLLGIENKYHETFLLGIVAVGENVQVFVDIHGKGTQEKMVLGDVVLLSDAMYYAELSDEQKKQIGEWIKKAE